MFIVAAVRAALPLPQARASLTAYQGLTACRNSSVAGAQPVLPLAGLLPVNSHGNSKLKIPWELQ